MKTLTKGILGTAIAVACVYCGYATYDSYIYQQKTPCYSPMWKHWDRMNQDH